ncbi:hypothetical protein F5J12DRAFT_862013 [Pisolithus orientalis]|uniref:uncharacterized protein n=1 Tax=Pisolithus orientalis TaxID=936130 RepID=UPI002224E638|nr:uncharacterized protein F5J12DRAFT_862013 [Pisolithus orientalis]KAI5991097.1 hypothetical protein F5J12DRAFT_862013 [Pisolithus orientalis]
MATSSDGSPCEQILAKLIAVVKHTQISGSNLTPQTTQALLQATNDYKNTLLQAKKYAATLPGGELNAEEQEELIAMLERLRDHKKQQLTELSERLSSMVHSEKMEVDSTASTPS